MEEISPEKFDQLMRAPSRSRKKKIERSFRAWFYDVDTFLGNCDNPNCMDTRGKSRCFVWKHPSGQCMCRFCYTGDWLADDENN